MNFVSEHEQQKSLEFKKLCETNDVKKIKKLLQKFPMFQNKKYLLSFACKYDCLTIAKYLYKTQNCERTENDYNDLFYKAHYYGNLKVAKWLLKMVGWTNSLKVSESTSYALSILSSIMYCELMYDRSTAMNGYNISLIKHVKFIKWLLKYKPNIKLYLYSLKFCRNFCYMLNRNMCIQYEPYKRKNINYVMQLNPKKYYFYSANNEKKLNFKYYTKKQNIAKM